MREQNSRVLEGLYIEFDECSSSTPVMEEKAEDDEALARETAPFAR